MLNRLFCLSLTFLVLTAAELRGQIQEVHVHDLEPQTAASKDPSAVLAASLETVFNEPDVCCGKNSSLEDSVLSADPHSLRDVAAKLQGSHVLSDGRPIAVTAEYLSPASYDAGAIIASILANRPLLMEWGSHLYVLYGVVFNQTIAYAGPDGGSQLYNTIVKLNLLDLRFADDRREKSFDRATDDWSKVQGLLSVSATRP